MKLLNIKPEATTSTTARATSAITSRLRSRLRLELPELLPPSLRASLRFTFKASRAGANPKTSEVKSEIASVKNNTLRSKPKSFSRGRLVETKATRVFAPTIARRKPSKPAIPPRSALSVSNCRSMRRRVAPKAVRIATSFCRLVAFARRRLATLAQAINNTSPTADKRITSGTRMSPVTCSCSEMT